MAERLTRDLDSGRLIRCTNFSGRLLRGCCFVCSHCSLTPGNAYVAISGMTNVACGWIDRVWMGNPDWSYVIWSDDDIAAMFNKVWTLDWLSDCVWRYDYTESGSVYIAGRESPAPTCSGSDPTPDEYDFDYIRAELQKTSTKVTLSLSLHLTTKPYGGSGGTMLKIAYAAWNYAAIEPDTCIEIDGLSGSLTKYYTVPWITAMMLEWGTFTVTEICPTSLNWVISTYYAVGDVARSGTTCYRCILAHASDAANMPPNPSYWELA